MALSDDSVSLDDLETRPTRAARARRRHRGRRPVSPDTVADADLTVRIPMAGGVDSLNVAAASAVAMWALRPR